MRSLAFLLPFVLVACNQGGGAPQSLVDTDAQDSGDSGTSGWKPDDKDTAPDTDVDTDPPVDTSVSDAAFCARDTADTAVNLSCNTGIRSIHPQDRSTGVYVKDLFSVSFTEAESTTATFRIVRTSDDTPLGVTDVTWDSTGKNVWFRPARALDPSTDYTLEVCHSCDEFAASFTTSAVGTTLASPSSLVGETYVIDPSTPRVVEPPGLGATMSSLLAQLDETAALAITGLGGGQTALQAQLGTVEASFSGSQVYGVTQSCVETSAMTPALQFTNPYLRFAGTRFKPDGYLSDVVLTGAFTPSGDALEGIEVSATMDVRDMGDILSELTEDGTPDAACNVLFSFGVPCAACSDGKKYCVKTVIHGLRALRAPSAFAFRTISAIDVENGCTVAN
ncbi:MAG: Ig-like domain-containing protein [Alphaproteobacteria bacterium]|nr:Ig-like domain-containing protein [Alphaproteobacteria bacterium]